MVLGSVFSPGLIKVGLEGEDREEVFEELVELYAAGRKDVSREAILAAVRAREEKQTTGVKPGIAFPHAQTDQVESVVGLIGISRDGIDYDAMDGKPVHVVFLMLSGVDACYMHLRVLKRLSIVLEDPEFYRNLLAQKDSTGVYEALRKYETILTSSV